MPTATYLDRCLDPVTDALTAEVAQQIVELRADPQLQAEIDLLRTKADNGTLSPQEETAYKDFVEALDVVSIIQAKARTSLP